MPGQRPGTANSVLRSLDQRQLLWGPRPQIDGGPLEAWSGAEDFAWQLPGPNSTNWQGRDQVLYRPYDFNTTDILVRRRMGRITEVRLAARDLTVAVTARYGAAPAISCQGFPATRGRYPTNMPRRVATAVISALVCRLSSAAAAFPA